jgi:C4-dicarboxylate transporter DctM subunit
MTSPELIGALGFLAMFVALALGLHIGVTLGSVGFLGCVALIGFKKSLSILTTTPFYTTADYSFIVLPMFVLMGEFAFQGGLGRLLFRAISMWLGRVHGGLAMATTAANALFGAVSGSSLAAAATFSKLAVPEMMRLNYDKKLACGVVAASGPLAAMIPPSGLMVLYCIFTQVSLGKVLIGGIIPGFLTALIFMFMIYFRVRLKPSLGPPSLEITSLKEKIFSIGWLAPVVIISVVMIGGIYGGIFSPVEGGAVGAFTVFVVVLFRKTLPIKELRNTLVNTARTSTMIFFIIIGGMIFGKFIALSGLPDLLLNFVKSIEAPPVVILLVILFTYIILGCVLEVVAMLAITLPMFFPLLSGLGIDGVWLGILTIQIVEIAVITPPIGLNVFVVKAVVGDIIGLGDLFRGIWPFFVMDLVILALLVAFPQIVLWLPSKMF